MSHLLYLGLGSNQGDRNALMQRALQLVEERIGHIAARSAFLETEPWGFDSLYPFLNAAVEVHTTLSPAEVLARTQEIERELGRTTKSISGRYADRTMDIDLLLYDNLVLEADYLLPGNTSPVHLSLPHPLMHCREFVLRPLVEIAPKNVHPVLGLTMEEIFFLFEQNCVK